MKTRVLILEMGMILMQLAIPGFWITSTLSPSRPQQLQYECISSSLFLPVFDLIANALMFIGLQYLDVSIHQTLRGAQIIFVALLKEYVLKHHLLKFHWVGVFWNMVSVVLVGVAALLAGYGGDEGSKDVTTAETILGVGLTLLGTFAQALTYATEEHIMKVDDPAPPLLVTGMIGFWGTVLCVVIVFPLAYWLPGDDHGSYEEPFSSWETVMSSTNIQIALVVYIFSVVGLGICGTLLIFQMSSVWHAMVVNFRPITVWATELFIYYVISQSYGEEWTHESFLLIAGMLILIYGTSIYNAPNAGSILLDGHWYSFGIDCSEEYEAIRLEKGEVVAKSEGLLHKSTPSTTGSLAGSWFSDSDDLFSSLTEYDHSSNFWHTSLKYR